MNEIFSYWINSVNWHQKFILIIDLGMRLAIAVVLSLVVGRGFGAVITKIASKSADTGIIPFNRSLLKKRVFRRMSLMLPFMLLYFMKEFIFNDAPKFEAFLERVLFSLLAALTLYVINAFLDAVEDYYHEFDVSRKNPIKGYLQMIKIFLAIAGVIIIISSLFNKSPWGVLSGLGAMTALILFVFKDWILGLVASVQINANNLVIVGDSIEMEKYQVNGEVIDISLSTVKVKNWDNTISMIPAYSLISESFKNWHGVKESGGRRIKRVLYVDINSISLPDDKILKKLKKLKLFKGTAEIRELSRSVKTDRSERINRSEITNIGLFRRYVELYLADHPGINSEKKLMAKLLEPSENGIPLQIYVFTNIIDVVEYENTVAGIFEHLIAVVPEFGLRLL